MGYVILRTQKLKDRGSITRSLKHSFRDQETPNANPEKTPENEHIGADSVTEVNDKITERLNTQPKIRKNAVLAIEYLVTGSPEILNEKSEEDQNKYFNDALDWMKEKHGTDNVVYAGIHRDETTPHLYAYVVPIDERGKLNCRAYLGGSKALNEIQTDFAKKVGNKHDLERGIEGSKAKHKTIKKYYAEIQKEPHQISADELPRRYKKLGGLLYETDESYAETVAEFVLDKVAPELEKAKTHKAANEEKARYQKAFFELRTDAQDYRNLTKDLTYKQQHQLKKTANELRKANEQAKAKALEQEEEKKQLEHEAKRKQHEQARRRNRRHGRGGNDLGF